MDYRISDSEYRFMQELWKQGLLDPEFERIVQEMITLATEAGYEECVEYTTNYLEMS